MSRGTQREGEEEEASDEEETMNKSINWGPALTGIEVDE